MKINVLISGFALFTSVALAGEIKYPVTAIAGEIKENADAVVRINEVTFTISSSDRATFYCHKVVSILNSKGKDKAIEIIPYDKLSKVTQLKATVYDAGGDVIKKLKNSEIYDQSYVVGYSLYDDSRVKAIDMTQAAYPYTVEIEYEIEYKYLFSIPPFYPVEDERTGVERSVYTLSYKPELAPRYEVRNTGIAPVKATVDGKEVVTWTFDKIAPMQIEPLSPPFEEQVPVIMAAPSNFTYDGYAGNMNTWETFGKWIISLNKGRNVLPDATKQKIKEITGGLNSTEEKVKKLYEYLQNKTRYVSIQLGIGGFQPFEAKVVDQTGYGDCKALSNYMVAILAEAGVKGYYVLIKAGEDESNINVNFPSTQFNHAFVCVPNGQDSLWLECTSQTNPFGYLGTFTSNRNALLITDDGARIIHTPAYQAEQNLQTRTSDVYVEATGDAKATIRTTYSGLQYENGDLNFILGEQYDSQKKWILKNTSIPNFDLNKFTFTNHKDKIPAAIVDLDLSLRRLASVSGKRLFLTPNLMNRSTFIPQKTEKRTTEVVRDFGYLDLDTIRYHLPQDIYPEFLPEPIKITSRFGEYEASFQVDQGSVVYTRKIKVYKGRFPAESYQELSDFYRSVNKADNTKLVFLNKT